MVSISEHKAAIQTPVAVSSTIASSAITSSETTQAKLPFHLLIKPIGPKCNLNCDYCFYLDKDKFFSHQNSYRMSDKVLKSLTQQYIEGQPEGTVEVNFSWQGGEPTLMGLEFFAKAIEYQQQFSRCGLRITNALQTNGTLLNDEWGKFLKKQNFLVGISVDGPMKLHDQLRKTKTGEGSFNLVKQGIEVLRQHKIEHNFLCTINSYNGDHPKKVYRALKSLGAEHIQFIPIVEHDFFEQDSFKRPFCSTQSSKRYPDQNNPNTGKTLVSKLSVGPNQFGKFLNTVFDEWTKQDIGKVFVQNFEAVLGKIMGSPASVCVYAKVCGRNLVVEHDGSVYSCDHYVYPQFKQANLQQTQIAQIVDSTKQTEFGLSKNNELCSQCNECPYLQFCHGDCPAHRIRIVKDDSKRLSYLCEGNKQFYQHSGPKLMQIARSFRKPPQRAL